MDDGILILFFDDDDSFSRCCCSITSDINKRGSEESLTASEFLIVLGGCRSIDEGELFHECTRTSCRRNTLDIKVKR